MGFDRGNQAWLKRKRCGSLKHGLSRTKAYRAWSTMMQRCYSPEVESYPLYGGRGIKVCERWRQSRLAFIEDMGEPPEGHSLDRIRSEGDYELDNCRWAPLLVQANNKRNTRVLTAFGETKPLREWSRDPRCVVSATVLWSRVVKHGWDAERALLEKPHRVDLKRVS